MILSKLYLGTISIVTNITYEENGDFLLDTKRFLTTLVKTIEVDGEKYYYDIVNNEVYSSIPNYEVGAKYLDREYELIPLDTILNQKVMSKVKVKKYFEFSKKVKKYEKL